MQVVKLSQRHTNLVKLFCEECQDVGYQNNASLDAMKWRGRYDLPAAAQFWGLIVNDELASISGCHMLESHIHMRCLFRSATLPRYSNLIPGMSKNHMNSIPFSLLLPYQILYGLEHGYEHFYVTTSHGEHDVSGRMNRTHKAISLLSKKGMLEFINEDIVYYTPQTKWKLVLPKYWSALKAFDDARSLLGIQPDKTYEKIRNTFIKF